MSRNLQTVTERNTYSAEQLAQLCLPGFPRSRKNWYVLLKRCDWEFVEMPGRGPGGVRREYIPPPDVQALIEAVQRGEITPSSPLKNPTNAPASNKAFNEMRVAERRITGTPKPPGDLDTPEGRVRFARESLELVRAGYSAEWLATGQGPMRSADQAAPAVAAARINYKALAVIMEATLKKFPEGSPAAVTKWAIDFYNARIDDGSLTPEGNGPGNLSNAA